MSDQPTVTTTIPDAITENNIKFNAAIATAAADKQTAETLVVTIQASIAKLTLQLQAAQLQVADADKRLTDANDNQAKNAAIGPLVVPPDEFMTPVEAQVG